VNESEGNWVGQISVVGSSLALQGAEIPWDGAAFGFRVAQIHALSVAELAVASVEYCSAPFPVPSA
jgi:hypothetical protein